jgi:hypothetical protein
MAWPWKRAWLYLKVIHLCFKTVLDSLNVTVHKYDFMIAWAMTGYMAS